MPEVINLHDINEMLKLLKGGYPVRQIRRSQYDPPEFDVPTEIYVVLNEYVYQDASCKPVFQEALTILFSGNAEDVFLGALYFDYCLSKETNKTASFSIDAEKMFPLLKDGIRRNKNRLMHRNAFLPGCNDSCMDWLTKLSSRYNKKYGFSLLHNE